MHVILFLIFDSTLSKGLFLFPSEEELANLSFESFSSWIGVVRGSAIWSTLVSLVQSLDEAVNEIVFLKTVSRRFQPASQATSNGPLDCFVSGKS